jgi:predicted nucleic acid-binding protein
VNVVELLGGDAPFVVDTSAWWRIPDLPIALARLVQQAAADDRMLITPIVRMEILNSARSAAEYARLDARLSLLRMLRNDRAAADAAMAAISELAERGDGYHRVWPPSEAL